MSTPTRTSTPRSTPDARRPEADAPGPVRSDAVGRPYNLILALTVVALSAAVFAAVMFLYRDTFREAALITTAMSTLFGIFGTVVGAYFGIKTTNDAHDKTREELAVANETARKALALLPPNEGRRVMDLEP